MATPQTSAELKAQLEGTKLEGSNRLPDLASKIKTDHKAIREALAVKGLVPKAIKIGEWLNEAKGKLDHGQMGAVVEERLRRPV